MNKQDFKPFVPKQTAFVGQIRLKYIHTSGLIHTYHIISNGHEPIKVLIHENGTIINQKEMGRYYYIPQNVTVQTPTVHWLLAQINEIKTYNCSISYPYSESLEPLLNKREMTGRGNKLQTLKRFIEQHVKENYEDPPYSFPNNINGHGLHISTNNPQLLAYYPDNKHILSLKAVQIKPGRYLKKYYQDLSDDDIRKYAGLLSGGLQLTFHSSFDEIKQVYRDLDTCGIVNSCMSGDDWSDKQHPLQVYHNSDVELAVLRDMFGNPLARALYNKNNKNYGMIYGQWEKMKTLLDAQGFIHVDLDGAKINKINRDDYSIVMPYIDGHRNLDRSMNHSTNVNIYDDYVIINRHGRYECNNTCGYIELEETFTCCCCGEHIAITQEYTVGWYDDVHACEFCYRDNFVEVIINSSGDTRYLNPNTYDNLIFSESTERYYFDDEVANLFDQYYCEENNCWYDEDVLIEIDGCYYHTDYHQGIIDELTTAINS